MATSGDYSHKSGSSPHCPAHFSILSASRATCKLPGCSRPRYTERYGFEHEFCGRTHAYEYRMKHGYHFASSHVSPATHATERSKKTKGPLKALPTSVFKSSSSTGSKDAIRFYNRDEPYYEFTNFYRGAPIVVDGKNWPTTEHFFQAQKFVGTPYVEVIRNLPTAREAFQISRSPKVSRWQRRDWTLVKDDVMLLAVRCKFVQHDPLRRKLLETGKKKLIEHTSNDSYWGDGGDGSGQNKLGELLMQVRQELGGGKETERELRLPLRRTGSFSSASGYRSETPRDDSYVYRERTPPPSTMKRSHSFSNLSRPSQYTASTSATRPYSHKQSERKPTISTSTFSTAQKYSHPKPRSTTPQVLQSMARVNRTSPVTKTVMSSCFPPLWPASSRQRYSGITESSKPYNIITNEPRKTN